MKTFIPISTLLILVLTFNHAFAQDSTKTKLTGTWFLVNERNTDTLTFSRTTTNQYAWGQKCVFQKDGKFIDKYDAKCGNDDNIHNDTGTWEIDSNAMTIKTTIPIARLLNKYKILTLETDKLVLVKP